MQTIFVCGGDEPTGCCTCQTDMFSLSAGPPDESLSLRNSEVLVTPEKLCAASFPSGHWQHMSHGEVHNSTWFWLWSVMATGRYIHPRCCRSYTTCLQCGSHLHLSIKMDFQVNLVCNVISVLMTRPLRALAVHVEGLGTPWDLLTFWVHTSLFDSSWSCSNCCKGRLQIHASFCVNRSKPVKMYCNLP